MKKNLNGLREEAKLSPAARSKCMKDAGRLGINYLFGFPSVWK